MMKLQTEYSIVRPELTNITESYRKCKVFSILHFLTGDMQHTLHQSANSS